MTHTGESLLHRQRGWSLFETMVAVGLVACGLLVSLQQLSLSFRETNLNENRAFAYQKAAAILAELQNSIALGHITKGAELQALADTTEQIVLTTRLDGEKLPFAADHVMSGNMQLRGHWQWARKLLIEPATESGLFICRVEMLHWGEAKRWDLEATQALQFSLLPEPFASVQSHDIYLLACGIAPSLAGDLAELRTHYENAAATIRQQSQAELRLHWITRLGYGRDPCYAPYVNTTLKANAAAPFAYWLPGRLAESNATLYRRELLGGLCLTDDGLFGGASATEAWPVTIADQYNHCMRTPAARTLFERRVAAGLELASSPPLQLLLDDLATHPELFRNAIFINLHGSALPMPPLRNFADAARDPEHLAGVRVVTHPARLQTQRDLNGDGNHTDTQDLELRVYAYRTMGSGDLLPTPILVQIYGPDLSANVNAASNPSLLVHRLQGGLDPNTGLATGNNRNYIGFDEVGGLAPSTGEGPFRMRCESGFVGGPNSYTWLKLYNTPLSAPVVGTRGLQTSARLYGLEYIPAAVSGSFTQDLAYDASALIERNTARWRIRVPKAAFSQGTFANLDQTIRIVTRIGGTTSTGIRWPAPLQPLNISETFAYWTRSAFSVPVTERAQFLGDPRHCPYADLTASGTAFAHGYNWHFDNLVAGSTNATALWQGLDAARLQDGFGNGNHADVPRLLQLLRGGLQNCGAVLVMPHGKTADTILLGGEIINSLGTPTQLHSAFTGGVTSQIDTLHAATETGARTLTLGATPTWWQKPWLGELFPDEQYATWFAQGNLVLPGNGNGLQWQLTQKAHLTNLPAGTDFNSPQGAQVGDAGAAMLLCCGTRSATFATPDVAAYTAQPTVAQNEINNATNLAPPSSLAVHNKLLLDHALPTAVKAFDFTSNYPRSQVTMLTPLWVRDGLIAGAILDCAETPAKRAYFVPLLATGGTTPLRIAAEQTLLCGIRAMHQAGLQGLTGRILQLPRIEILEPQAGVSVSPDGFTLRWKTDWRRFDDQPYTSAYPEGFNESESDLVYRILWSNDDCASFTSALTGRSTTIGTWPEVDDCLRDTSTGTESFTLSPATSLSDGVYVFILEAWRANGQCHSSSQRLKITINHAALASRRNP